MLVNLEDSIHMADLVTMVTRIFTRRAGGQDSFD